MFARFEVPGQPAFAVIDADGEVQQIIGAVDDALIDDILGGVVGS